MSITHRTVLIHAARMEHEPLNMLSGQFLQGY